MNHHWKCKFKFNPDTSLGFIYAIINKKTGQTYYGRKQFWKFRKRKKLPDHTWRFYHGSSKSLNLDIEKYGLAEFQFWIIATFNSKSGMAIGESTAIICSGSLEEPAIYYNRSAPSIRGSIKINEDDARSLQKIRDFIHGRKEELRKHEG